jgi:hypothetical protein
MDYTFLSLRGWCAYSCEVDELIYYFLHNESTDSVINRMLYVAPAAISIKEMMSPERVVKVPFDDVPKNIIDYAVKFEHSYTDS